jgi:hypothetical protein
MRHFIHHFTKFCLTIAVLFAMTGIGFAHKVASPDIDESLLAYVQAGGALDDLCGDADFGEGHGQSCEACRLVDGAVVPAFGVVAVSRIEPSPLETRYGKPFVAFAQTLNPSCPVRAPPVV